MGRKVLHIRNGNNNVLPTPAQILVGEIAINYFKDNEMLAIKNSAGEVVTFSSDTLNNAYRQTNERVVAAALNDLEERKLDKSEAEDFITAETDPTVPAWAKSPTKPSYTAAEVGALPDSTKYGVSIYYDTENKQILLKDADNNTLGSPIDATAFIKDGMVSSASVTTPSEGGNAGVKCLVITFNTDAGKQPIEIPLSDFLTVDDELDATSENPLQNKVIKENLDRIELVTAAALNDLEGRKLDRSEADGFLTSETDPTVPAWAKAPEKPSYDASEIVYTTESETQYLTSGDNLRDSLEALDEAVAGKQDELTFDTEPVKNSTNPVTSGGVYAVIADSEEIVAASLNDLEDRKLDKVDAQNFLTQETDPTVPAWAKAPSKPSYAASEIAYNGSDVETALDSIESDIADKQDKLTFDSVPTANSTNPVTSGGLYTVIVDNEKVTSATFNDIEQRTLDKDEAASIYAPQSSTYTKSEVDNLVQGSVVNVDDELLADSENPVQNKVIAENILRIETVTAAALNDLNDKTQELGADTDSLKASVQSINGTIADIQDEIDSLSPEYIVNGKTGTADSPIVLDGRDIKLTGYTSPSNNTDYDPITPTDTINQAFSKVMGAMTDNEEVASAAINDLDARLSGVSSDLQTLIENPVEPMVAVTYSELVALKGGGELAAGSWYRITDYQCTTTQTDTSSANHPFDIIVLALSSNTLSEEARSIQHEGDTYFANSKLNAWKVWYCLENDTTRFLWADATNGKGVVYRLIDEFNNDIKYDFKNILFTRNLTDGAYDSEGEATWCYTLNVWHEGACKDASVIGNTLSRENDIVVGVYSNNFGYVSCYSVGITKTSFVFCLGNNVVLSIDYGNEYYGFYNNMIGDGSYNNTFGDYCYSNTFVSHCHGNTFGTDCYSNAFGNYCYNNTFGNSCYSNTFGNACYNNTFGNSCNRNTFGNDCNHNRFGTGASTKNNVRYICVENGVQYVNITTTATTSASAYLRNITISQGISGTDASRKTISHPTVGDTFQTIYRPANSQIVSV